MPRFIRTNQDLPKFSDYTRYRPYLRKDFEYRCAYCEITETSVFGIIALGIDHFRPKTRFPDRSALTKTCITAATIAIATKAGFGLRWSL